MKKILTIGLTLLMSVLAYADWKVNEGFEDNTFPPADWSSPHTWALSGGNSYAPHTGAGWAFSDFNNNFLITPQINVAAGDSLIFWYRSEESLYYQDFDIMLSTTDSDTSSFTVLERVFGPESDMYQRHKVDLSSYAGDDVHIAFVTRNIGATEEFGLILDDIMIGTIPTGPVFDIAPSAYDFPITPVNTTSAETAEFIISNDGYGPFEIASADDISLIGENSVDFGLDLSEVSGWPITLEHGDTQKIYLTFTPQESGAKTAQIQIVDNISRNTNVIDVSGEAINGILEHFDSGTFPPEGWSTYILGDGTAGWKKGSLYQSEYHSAFHNDDNVASGCEDWLVLPLLDLSETAQISFYEKNSYVNTSYEHHGLWISTGSGDPADGDFVNIAEFNEDTGGTAGPWMERTVDLTAYNAAGAGYLAFKYSGDFATKWSIDDVSVINSPSSIEENFSVNDCSLSQNYPNPFNPSTTIKFHNNNAGIVKLAVYNIKGELVKQLLNKETAAGHHSINFDGADVNSGVYYYTLKTGSSSITKKMVLVK